MQGWLKETFTEVWVEEVWPPSSPYCKPFDYFCAASLNYGPMQILIEGSDPEDQGGDGVPRQGHPCEGLHELQVQDRGWQFY
jgi:hypothetical protein